MKFFREMIDLARTMESIPIAPGTIPNMVRGATVPVSDFFTLAEKAQPFVFTSLNLSDEQNYELGQRDDQRLLNAPFEVMAVEVLGGYLTETPKHFLDKNLTHIQTKCVLAFEALPGKFLFYTYEIVRLQPGDPPQNRIFFSGHYTAYLNRYLEELERSKVGMETARSRVKIGIGKEKRVHTFSSIIHVTPKRHQYDRSPESGREIDWAYRFSVRGHWRKHDGIGKDRNGELIQNGFTWVKEHIKGPEHLPLVTKTRVVSSPTNNS